MNKAKAWTFFWVCLASIGGAAGGTLNERAETEKCQVEQRSAVAAGVAAKLELLNFTHSEPGLDCNEVIAKWEEDPLALGYVELEKYAKASKCIDLGLLRDCERCETCMDGATGVYTTPQSEAHCNYCLDRCE